MGICTRISLLPLYHASYTERAIAGNGILYPYFICYNILPGMHVEESFPGEQSLQLWLKNGERAHFNDLFYQLSEPVMTYIRFRLQDESAAEDVLQEVFIKLWNRRTQIDVHTSFKNYLYTIVQNCVNDHLRTQKRKKWQAADLPPDTQEDRYQPDDHYQHKQLHQLWKQAVKRLPGQMARIYLMKNEDALSVREIASELELSEQTVKNQLYTAGQRIVKLLQQVNILFWILTSCLNMNELLTSLFL